jgi:hypothetical protein
MRLGVDARAGRDDASGRYGVCGTPRAMIMLPSMFQWIRIGHPFRNACASTEVRELSDREDARRDSVRSGGGSVPRSLPLRSVAGLGSGLPCVLCEGAIAAPEPEVEVYFLSRPFEPYFFHGTCYAVWLRRVVPGPRVLSLPPASAA